MALVRGFETRGEGVPAVFGHKHLAACQELQRSSKVVPSLRQPPPAPHAILELQHRHPGRRQHGCHACTIMQGL